MLHITCISPETSNIFATKHHKYNSTNIAVMSIFQNRLFSNQIQINHFEEIFSAKHEYMDIHTPINVLVPAQVMIRKPKINQLCFL